MEWSTYSRCPSQHMENDNEGHLNTLNTIKFLLAKLKIDKIDKIQTKIKN